MAPEIINTRRYNLKADVYSWSMVALEMMTWKKPYSDYTPEEHTKCVAGLGKRPNLVVDNCDEPNNNHDNEKYSEVIPAQDWPSGVAELLQESWSQDVAGRLTMQSVLERMGTILADFETVPDGSAQENTLRNDATEVVLEFPSHFSPRHQLAEGNRHEPPRQPLSRTASRDDSDFWFEDRQSDASTSYQELTMTSASTTMHDSNSIQTS